MVISPLDPHFENHWSRPLILNLSCTLDSLGELKKNNDAWVLPAEILI